MSASDWDPSLYCLFDDERTRAAVDLLGRVSLRDPAVIVDLGSGPGNSTELLARRYPGAAVSGVDSSAAMVAAARKRLPACSFEQADVADWSPDHAPDLIFANAVLQWVPDHDRVLPRLLASLRPGGVLAIQMPDNLEEPSHRAMRIVAAEDPWGAALAEAAAARTPLPPLEYYYDLVCAEGASVDTWRTCYYHPMTSPRSIVDWVRATGLRPFLAALQPVEQADFLARYEQQIDEHYPARADGQRLLAFPRLFIVARKASV